MNNAPAWRKNEDILRAESISRIFRQGTEPVEAVKKADIRIGEGERVYIHGPSGAGKSSLLHMLAGLCRPTEGNVKLKGSDIYKMGDKKRSKIRNRHFGFVFQLYYLLPEFDVLENVMLPAMIKGSDAPALIRKKAFDILQSVGMAGRLKHRPSQLSGGEVQRTAIARALINSPEVLFCDEPAGNLDSEMGREIYEIIRHISDNRKMSVVLVSHQEIESVFFHREYVMRDGVLEKANGGVEIASSLRSSQ